MTILQSWKIQILVFKSWKINKYEIGFSDIGEMHCICKHYRKTYKLDNSGSDHSASLNVKYLKSFVNKINDIKQSINSSKKQITKLEKNVDSS